MDVVRRRKDEIYEVMGELAGIVEEENGSSWSRSRKECVERTSHHFRSIGLHSHDLVPKLKKLVRFWNPEWSVRA